MPASLPSARLEGLRVALTVLLVLVPLLTVAVIVPLQMANARPGVVTSIGAVIPGSPATAMVAGTRPAAAIAAPSTAATVTVSPETVLGPLVTRLSTNLVYPNIIEGIDGGQARLNALAPPLLRLHAGTDGTWPGGPGPALPAGETQGDWDFSSLNQLVGDVRAYG